MTKEEIKKEAYDYASKYSKENDFDRYDTARFSYYECAVIKEKRIAELEVQIEKMKLCANCRHCGVSGWCDKLNRYLLDKANQSCGNWEIKEK